MRKLLILSALALCACATPTKTPLERCIDHIKEELMFEENEVKGFTYAYTKAQESSYQYAYFVDLAYEDVYGEWAENWLCGISFLKGEVSELNCTRLARFAL